MTILIGPNVEPSAVSPSVGIFWKVNCVLLIDRTRLEDAERYGDCLTHSAGHYERWQEWQALSEKDLSSAGYPGLLRSTEYDEWPRGRIVYEMPNRRFVLYADRRLQKPRIVETLKMTFGLSAVEVAVRSDAHYRRQ